ncbi:hypothetical protein [Planococcus antarcticus]|nr:hypothetical protein [Planococcus antarcticus]
MEISFTFEAMLAFSAFATFLVVFAKCIYDVAKDIFSSRTSS